MSKRGSSPWRTSRSTSSRISMRQRAPATSMTSDTAGKSEASASITAAGPSVASPDIVPALAEGGLERRRTATHRERRALPAQLSVDEAGLRSALRRGDSPPSLRATGTSWVGGGGRETLSDSRNAWSRSGAVSRARPPRSGVVRAAHRPREAGRWPAQPTRHVRRRPRGGRIGRRARPATRADGHRPPPFGGGLERVRLRSRPRAARGRSAGQAVAPKGRGVSSRSRAARRRDDGASSSGRQGTARSSASASTGSARRPAARSAEARRSAKSRATRARLRASGAKLRTRRRCSPFCSRAKASGPSRSSWHAPGPQARAARGAPWRSGARLRAAESRSRWRRRAPSQGATCPLPSRRARDAARCALREAGRAARRRSDLSEREREAAKLFA